MPNGFVNVYATPARKFGYNGLTTWIGMTNYFPSQKMKLPARITYFLQLRHVGLHEIGACPVAMETEYPHVIWLSTFWKAVYSSTCDSSNARSKNGA